MKTIMFRTVMLAMMVFCVVAAIVTRTGEAMVRVPFYVWCDIREDWDEFSRMWLAGRVE